MVNVKKTWDDVEKLIADCDLKILKTKDELLTKYQQEYLHFTSLFTPTGILSLFEDEVNLV